MVKRYPFSDPSGLYMLSGADICTAEFVVDAVDYDALAAELAKISRELEVQKGVVEFVYIPVRHMTERADKYESKSKRFEAALREIAGGLVPVDSAAGNDQRYQLCAGRLCKIARDALRATAETACGAVGHQTIGTCPCCGNVITYEGQPDPYALKRKGEQG